MSGNLGKEKSLEKKQTNVPIMWAGIIKFHIIKIGCDSLGSF